MNVITFNFLNKKHAFLKFILIIILIIKLPNIAQTATISGNVINNNTNNPISKVDVQILELNKSQVTDETGNFRFENLKKGTYQLVFFAEGFSTEIETVNLATGQQLNLKIGLDSLTYDLEAVEIEAQKREIYGLRRLNNVEGMAIYAAKKSEVIEMQNLLANLATNNARQIYKGIAGLNIWENDGGGLQLSIGARGLDPNRTSNFNTRQNGYDISADALGYPESYYTPPSQALQRIEIVRGAASLQYGPQFGGLLNFVFKKGNLNKKLEVISENTVGSFNLFNSFTSLGGSHKGLNYYSFYQRKQGNGWRPNSQFEQNTAFINLTKSFKDKVKIGLEYTHMDYLAQQAGGLVDFAFQQDARQSIRSRNWFKVNWNLAALLIDVRLSEKTKLNSRSFLLDAQRQALGNLNPINRPDDLRDRELIRGVYDNFGNETRLIHRYGTDDILATFLIGTRFYKGFSTSEQGFANALSTPDFEYLNPDNLERFSYEFPSQNFSIFAENLFSIRQKWTITPGLRFENIQTASDGFYKNRVISGGQVILEQKIDDARDRQRSLLLIGLGVGYKPHQDLELYSNFSQNYRSINFTDLAVANPNLVVDSLLQDERGYNFDVGVRGNISKTLRFDASLFYLRYQNRIGIGEIIVPDPAVIERAIAYRTNIADAGIIGLETYAELDLLRLLKKSKPSTSLSVFTNLSLLNGQYLSGEAAFEGKEVELIPPFSFKTGLNFSWKKLNVAYQFAFVDQHFSDATNAERTNDATRGIIPAYQVQDVSFQYTWRQIKLQAGVNNLTDSRYFTRRAAAYPGPGIIPSDGRNFYLTIGFQI